MTGMTRPVQITFRNLDASPALEDAIRARVAWLETFHAGIVGCRVIVEIPHRHRKRGRPLHVRIELSLPGKDLVVSHEPTVSVTAGDAPPKSAERSAARKDALVAIHDAFDVARRRLEDVVRRSQAR
jgi:hypothetical protein